MSKPENETIYFERGMIRVTADTLTTRYKDEALAPVQSVQIGRDALWMAGVVALGLLLFANRFGDLLQWHEQALLMLIGIAVAIAGYCTATLQIGQHMRERTVLVAPIWTINAVRRAIAAARHTRKQKVAGTILVDDDAD